MCVLPYICWSTLVPSIISAGSRNGVALSTCRALRWSPAPEIVEVLLPMTGNPVTVHRSGDWKGHGLCLVFGHSLGLTSEAQSYLRDAAGSHCGGFCAHITICMDSLCGLCSWVWGVCRLCGLTLDIWFTLTTMGWSCKHDSQCDILSYQLTIEIFHSQHGCRFGHLPSLELWPEFPGPTQHRISVEEAIILLYQKTPFKGRSLHWWYYQVFIQMYNQKHRNTRNINQ